MIEDAILKNFTNKHVLVTGGTGLIGRQVVRILCDAGSRVKIVSLDNLNGIVHVPQLGELYQGDVTLDGVKIAVVVAPVSP